MNVYVDQGVSQRRIKEIKKEHDINFMHVGHYEQLLKQCEDVSGYFVLGRSQLDGTDVLGLADNVELQIIRIVGKNNKLDIAHLMSAAYNGCNVFLTNDLGEFIRNGKKEKLEQILSPMKIMTLDMFEDMLQ